eukprot:Nk52_evm52s1360 gene=Nk52_evmTU52s1360
MHVPEQNSAQVGDSEIVGEEEEGKENRPTCSSPSEEGEDVELEEQIDNQTCASTTEEEEQEEEEKVEDENSLSMENSPGSPWLINNKLSW